MFYRKFVRYLWVSPPPQRDSVYAEHARACFKTAARSGVDAARIPDHYIVFHALSYCRPSYRGIPYYVVNTCGNNTYQRDVVALWTHSRSRDDHCHHYQRLACRRGRQWECRVMSKVHLGSEDGEVFASQDNLYRFGLREFAEVHGSRGASDAEWSGCGKFEQVGGT